MKFPSSAGEPLVLVATVPLSAAVLASKVPPTVIEHMIRTLPCCTGHVRAATTVVPARSIEMSVGFITLFIVMVLLDSLDATVKPVLISARPRREEAAFILASPKRPGT